MLCQQNIAIKGADDFYSRMNEDQNVNVQVSKPRLWIRGLSSSSELACKQKEDILNIFQVLPLLNKQTKLLTNFFTKILKIIS